jgi:hypothetical protein
MVISHGHVERAAQKATVAYVIRRVFCYDDLIGGDRRHKGRA